ncbi:DinB family protein [Prauserella marina]|nr:maleylpyruvate isomerase family mycothiol-dependent enzyme [Prauserella marina]ASR33796.1 DinB family protein [Prauserella marina]
MSDMEMASAERADLADLLSTLTPEQWDTPSLCEGWRVRDVVAHVAGYEDLDRFGLARRFVRGWIVNTNQVRVEELRGLTNEELLDRLRSHLVPRGVTSGFGGMIALVDGTIHHQDIRRPLGLPREIPAARLRRVLDATMRNPRLPAWRVTRGLRLTATDLDWSHGKGREVRGPAEALLMAAAGRQDAVTELEGPGQRILANRLAR